MKKNDREAEAKAALERLHQQSERLLGAEPPPSDEPDDKIEILGKRIARVLSMIIMAGLIFYLWRTYFSG
jgi:hypothetical protein